jgi:hypothetical protein
MRFMAIMIPDVYQKPVAPDFISDPEVIEKMGKMGRFNEELQKAGVLLAVDGLCPPAAAARVSFPGGKPMVTDGPFAETKEAIGGYWMLQVKSRDEAIEWMRRCPAEPGDVIEIRQIFDPEHFSPEVARQERELLEKIGRNR